MPGVGRRARGRSAAAQRGPGQREGRVREGGGGGGGGGRGGRGGGGSFPPPGWRSAGGGGAALGGGPGRSSGWAAGGERSRGVGGGRASRGLGARGSRGPAEGKRASGGRIECGPWNFSMPRVPLSGAQVGPQQPLLHTETISVSRMRLFLPPLPSGKAAIRSVHCQSGSLMPSRTLCCPARH